MTTIQGKTPAELCEEWEGFSDVDVLKDTEWLRSSMKSLLEYVEGEMPQKITIENDSGHDCYEQNCGYCDAMFRNSIIDEMYAKIREIKNSI